jgi:hypothetical protein
MATTPQFSTAPNIGMQRLTAASMARDTIVPAPGDLVFTAGANGSRIDRVDVMASAAEGGAAAARVTRLWLFDGTTARLLRELELPAVTPSATVKGAQQTVYFTNGLVLPAGWTLRATLSVAGANDAVTVIAYGGDY